MNIIEALIAGLRSPKTTVGGILTAVALIVIGAKEELASDGIDVGMWAEIAAGIGVFITALFSRDANVSSTKSLEPPKL